LKGQFAPCTARNYVAYLKKAPGIMPDVLADLFQSDEQKANVMKSIDIQLKALTSIVNKSSKEKRIAGNTTQDRRDDDETDVDDDEGDDVSTDDMHSCIIHVRNTLTQMVADKDSEIDRLQRRIAEIESVKIHMADQLATYKTRLQNILLFCTVLKQQIEHNCDDHIRKTLTLNIDPIFTL
jgi:hypothetical protein